MPLVAEEQPSAGGPLGVLLAAAAAAGLPGGVLADLGEHLVPECDEVELVGDEDRVRERVTDGFGVGGGQVDGHVRDRLFPRIGLCRQAIRSTLAAVASVDVREQPGGAGRVDDGGVPPVVHDPPPAGDRVLFPDRLAAAGLIDPEHRDLRQQMLEDRGDVRDERGVRDRPGHPVRPARPS